MKNKSPYELLILICEKARYSDLQLFLINNNLNKYILFDGQGSAKSVILDVLGLTATAKTVLGCMIKSSNSDMILEKLKQEFGLLKNNTGIAMTISLDGASSNLFDIADLENFKKEN